MFTVSTWRRELPHMESWTLSCLHLCKEHWSDWVFQNFTHIRWANNNTEILIVKGGFSNAWIALWWSTMILKFPWTAGSWSECSNEWEEYCGGYVNCKWKVLVLQRSCLGGAFKESQCLCSLLVSYKGIFQFEILGNLYWFYVKLWMSETSNFGRFVVYVQWPCSRSEWHLLGGIVIVKVITCASPR